ncbi:MAG: DUF4838 domain-containing protein [Clostridia bacterium]|nr:DUF4838 domain-containing protein [Clostridia bacterium]
MKLKQITAALLLAACTLSCGCNNGGESGSKGPVTAGIVTEPGVTGYVEGTLHNVNVKYDAPVGNFAVNGKSDYKLVIGKTNNSKAAGFIAMHVLNATKAKVDIIEYSQDLVIDENTKYIVIGCEDKFVELGGEVPTYETIGVSGYQIQTVGKNVFINGYTENGYQMGAIAFLRALLGYDMLMEDCVVYELDGKELPQMDIIERPDFDYRQQGGACTNTEIYGMGFTYTQIWINPNNGSFCHNWYEYVSLEEADENPDWASNDSTRWQGCWTSRGNKDTYKGLINHITEKVKKFLRANPNVDNLMLAQHDIGGNTPQVQNCRCTSCQASYEYYGGTMAGAWLSLANRVSLQVDEWLQSDEAIEYFGGVKDFNFIELVYHTSVNPPAEKDASGNYILDAEGKGTPKQEMWFNNDGSMQDWDEAWDGSDENSTETSDVVAQWTQEQETVNCAPSVQLCWATSAADWTHAYTESENASWADMARAWSGFGGDFYVWAYSLNSESAVHPYNSFDTFFESTKFFRSFGAKWMFWQGFYENPKNGGFEKLHRYLESKVEFDVNADYQYYVDKFFKYNYGAGGEYMQQYFEEVLLQCRYIEKYNAISGNIHNRKLLYKENWPEGLVKRWISLTEKAYEAIEEHKSEDPVAYEAYRQHILMESLFPRYVLCTNYESSYEETELKVMRQQYLDDFYALGNKAHAEGRAMNLVSDTWNLD